MSPSALCYLQTLPPIPNVAALNHHREPPPQAPYSITGARRRRLHVVCAGGGSKGSTRSADDYNATLRALNSKGRFPRKSLGQHYMLNSEINEQLAGVAGIEQGDVVLEIGPGTGSLTNILLDSGAFVLAVEKVLMRLIPKVDHQPGRLGGLAFLLERSILRKDKHMAALVSERFSSTGKLKVLTEDIVRCHVRSHMSSLVGSTKKTDPETRNAKVVANIPFNISTDVVKLLLPMGDIFSEVVLLLQEETAVRLVVSSLRTSEYRPINIFVNYYSDPEYKFKVPRTDFFPQPNVDAAVVSFKLKLPSEYPQVSSSKSFFSMVNSGFNEKRKMLRKSLQHICTSLEIEEALKSLGLQPTSRPEELTLDDFVKLHNLISKE